MWQRTALPAIVPDAVEMGHGTYHSKRLLVTALDDKSAMIAVRLNLVDDHFRNRISALKGVTHSLIALCGSITHDRCGKIKRNPSVLPDAQRSPGRCLKVHNMGRMVGRSPDNGNTRRIFMKPVINFLQGPIRRIAFIGWPENLFRPVQKAGHTNGLIGLTLNIVTIWIIGIFDIWIQHNISPPFKLVNCYSIRSAIIVPILL